MRVTHRRRRQSDPLARPEAVSAVTEEIRSLLPEIIPRKNKDLIKMLRAARHLQRYAATDTRRGRPGHWRREDLLRVAACLGDILDRETSGRVSVASFVDHYLRVPEFPGDVAEALTSGAINLFEAEQLARVTHSRLDSTPAQSRRVRAEMLSSHLKTKAPGGTLRRRVNELLGAPPAGEGDRPDYAAGPEDFDPYDSTHLFWEQIKQLGFAFREIKREDVTDEELEELLAASEPVMSVIARIRRRKEQTKGVGTSV